MGFLTAVFMLLKQDNFNICREVQSYKGLLFQPGYGWKIWVTYDACDKTT